MFVEDEVDESEAEERAREAEAQKRFRESAQERARELELQERLREAEFQEKLRMEKDLDQGQADLREPITKEVEPKGLWERIKDDAFEDLGVSQETRSSSAKAWKGYKGGLKETAKLGWGDAKKVFRGLSLGAKKIGELASNRTKRNTDNGEKTNFLIKATAWIYDKSVWVGNKLENRRNKKENKRNEAKKEQEQDKLDYMRETQSPFYENREIEVSGEDVEDEVVDNKEEGYALARIKEAKEKYKDEDLTGPELTNAKSYKGRVVAFEDGKKYKVEEINATSKMVNLREVSDKKDSQLSLRILPMPIKHFLKVQAELGDEAKIVATLSAKEIAEIAQEKVKKIEVKTSGRKGRVVVLGKEYGKTTDDNIRGALSVEAGTAIPVEIKKQQDFYDFRDNLSSQEQEELEKLVEAKEKEKQVDELSAEEYAQVVKEIMPQLEQIRRDTYRNIMREIRARGKFNELEETKEEANKEKERQNEKLRQLILQVKNYIADDKREKLIKAFTKQPQDLEKLIKENESFRFLGNQSDPDKFEFSGDYVFTSDELDYLEDVREEVSQKLVEARDRARSMESDYNSDYVYIKYMIKHGSKDDFFRDTEMGLIDLDKVIENSQKLLEVNKDYAPLSKKEIDRLIALSEDIKNPKKRRGYNLRRGVRILQGRK